MPVNDGTSGDESGLGLSAIGSTILAGASAALVLRASGAGLKYLMEVLFARWLGPEAYGAFAYAYNWAQLLSVVAGLGLVTTVLRFVPAYRSEQAWGKLRGLVLRSQQWTVSAALVLFGVGAGLLFVVPYGHRWTLLIGLACIVPMALIHVQSALVRSLKQISLAYVGKYVLWPVGSIAAVYGLLQVVETPSGRLATGGIALALSLIAIGQLGLIRRVFPRKMWHAAPDAGDARRWLAVSMPLLLMSGFQIVLNRADVLMVGTLMGAADAGLYNAAARTGHLLSFLLSAFNAIAAPLIGEYWADRDLDALENLVTTAVRWVFWPSLVLAAGLFALYRPILGLFGREFVSAWPVLVLVGTGQLIHAVTGPVGYLMGLTGHERQSAWVFGTSAVLNILLNAALIPLFGLVGSATATMISVAVQNLWLVRLVRGYVGISIVSVWRRALLFRS